MITFMQRVVPWVVYPATMVLVIALHVMLLNAGQSIAMASYVPVLLGASMVTWLEWQFPQDPRWHPPLDEIRNDIVYMLLVQIALPKLLGLLVVLWVVDVSQTHPTALWAYWPHAWPVWAQAILMVCAADFMRYWLHRFAHTVPLLWRFHAVHHSPHRLYWLNVGRFHPVDKALQFLLDSLPFILVGVGADVVALYFVFYAVNGFFQHSNIRLRYGILNYLISSAELHRWHHSRKVEESNTNYGNNIIIWDMLFGTRFFPAARNVETLGLMNRHYPMGFIPQMGSPFTPDIIYRDVPMQNVSRVAGRWLTWIVMQWVRFIDWQRLRAAARTPQRTQHAVLRRILNENKSTRFGQAHGFADISTPDTYTQRVPMQDYESLHPYIMEQELTGTPALTRASPFMYAVTSGTTGEPKYLPVVAETLKDYRQEQRLLARVLFRFCPMAFTGKVLGLASPAVEGHRDSGVPYGSVSGQLYANIPRLMQLNNVLPPAVYDVLDTQLKYRLMLRLALAEPQITHMIGANPSSFLRLLSELNSARDLLADSLEQGGVTMLGVLPNELAGTFDSYLVPVPERARRLRAMPRDRELTYADLWPEIRLLTVWTGGSCGVALDSLRQTLPESTKVVELGYIASELRATITVDPIAGTGVPTLHHHYFEFIERGAWDSGDDSCLQLHELEQGHEYYVVVTTRAGLYRYFMNDLVRVEGMFENTPTLRFLQKGRGVTSITGEKLYESQLLQAVSEVMIAHRLTAVFVMGLADEHAAHYRVYVETDRSVTALPVTATIAAALDTRLGELNIEYQAKRTSGRLHELQFYWLTPGAGEAYKHHCMQQHQREGQFKTVALQLASEFSFDLDPYGMTSGDDSK